MRKLLLVLLSCATLGCGRDRYEIVATSSSAAAYRLDRQTGEVVFIYGKESAWVLAPGETEEINPITGKPFSGAGAAKRLR